MRIFTLRIENENSTMAVTERVLASSEDQAESIGVEICYAEYPWATSCTVITPEAPIQPINLAKAA